MTSFWQFDTLRTALRSAGLAVPPIRRLLNIRDELIAEWSALLAQLAATQAAPDKRTEQLTALQCRTFGKCCLYTAYDRAFDGIAAYTVPAMCRYATCTSLVTPIQHNRDF